MKGLLLKDYYLTVRYCRMYFLVALLFIAVSSLSFDNTFFLLFPCIFSGALPMTLIAYDEREKWDVYASSLPYTRSQMVSVKYILGLIWSGLTLSLIFIIQVIKNTAQPIENIFSLLAVLAVISLITPALLLPWVFKLGAEKGRIFYYIIAALYGFSMIFVPSNRISEPYMVFPNSIILFLLIVFVYAVSWIISIQIYKRREF